MTVKHLQLTLTQSQSKYVEMVKVHHGYKSKKEALSHIVDEMMKRVKFEVKEEDSVSPF